MTRIAKTLCALSAATALAGVLLAWPAAAADKPNNDAFVSIFNGKDLTGWEGLGDWWYVEDGALTAQSTAEKPCKACNYLMYRGSKPGDFELRLKFKVLGKGVNAGVQIRSRRIPNHHEMIGYQADLGDGWWGCLYDESRRNKVLAGPPGDERSKIVRRDDWNDYTIRCQGRRIQLWINGKQTVDYTEPDKSIEQAGLIGLQIHGGPPSEAWYKEIRFKELPEK